MEELFLFVYFFIFICIYITIFVGYEYIGNKTQEEPHNIFVRK